jgi:hypothetical protein
MYTATSGLMFDTPEDAALAAALLQALFDQAQARQSSDDTGDDTVDKATGDALDSTRQIQMLSDGVNADAGHARCVTQDSDGREFASVPSL